MLGLTFALVAVALCVATCAARVGVVAADGASWSEDLDGLDEYLLDSPRLTQTFMQQAMREEREKKRQKQEEADAERQRKAAAAAFFFAP